MPKGSMLLFYLFTTYAILLFCYFAIFMLVEFHQQPRFRPDQLDYFLEHGWFRASQIMQRSEIISMDGQLSTIFNIRYPLDGFRFSKSFRKIKRRGDKDYRLVQGPYQPSPEKEELYQKFKNRFKGYIHPTLNSFLKGPMPLNPFETSMIEVYDDQKLIAFSLFDIGKQSMAGLLAVYDFNYTEASLGHYTMIKEVELGQFLGLNFYYPGYILDLERSFDYKLRLGEPEYLIQGNRWSTREELDRVAPVGRIIEDQSTALLQLVQHYFPNAEKWHHPYFSLGYLSMPQAQFIHSPLLISASTPDTETFRCFYIDPETRYYHDDLVETYSGKMLIQNSALSSEIVDVDRSFAFPVARFKSLGVYEDLEALSYALDHSVM